MKVEGFREKVSGFRFQVSGFRWQVSGGRFQVEGFRFQVSGWRFKGAGFRFQVSGGEGGWILRLDADEYLTEELVEEIKQKLPGMPEDVDGVVLKRRHVVGWLGDVWVKRGMYPARILRLFRRGKGRARNRRVCGRHALWYRWLVDIEIGRETR